nr:MAG TPA: hypothetical protein [Caudoviricetes sp.]
MSGSGWDCLTMKKMLLKQGAVSSRAVDSST